MYILLIFNLKLSIKSFGNMIELSLYVQVTIMEKILNEYKRWTLKEDMPGELMSELMDMKDDEKLIEDAFYRELEFGTSGLRGIMGPGTNRMNQYIVAKVSTGFSNYMNKNISGQPKIVISYDSRHNSELFAKISGEIFSAKGIKAYIFDKMLPVSILSYAIRELKCDFGLMITASHNPKEYNGYKVYDNIGCQILTDVAEGILNEIEQLDVFDDVPVGTSDNIVWLDDQVKDKFVAETLECSIRCNREFEEREKALREISQLKICYSPLNGAGREPVIEVLKGMGVGELHLVKQQEMRDENFTTCPKPNPERKDVYALGQKLMEETNSDILILTDPDCDRIGVATSGGILSGNDLAVLLFDYICRNKKPLVRKPVAIRSIVSTPLVDAIAEDHGVAMEYTLIGFKYIGQKMEQLGSRFIFGFEEGNGYQAFGHMRDKDGVSTAMLVCEMAAEYKAKGISLQKALKNIYKKYGYYEEKVVNYRFSGKEGLRQREAIMKYLREDIDNSIKFFGIKSVKDYKYQKNIIYDLGVGSFTEFPVANILEYSLGESQKFIVRPSGTEPSLKAYFFAKSRYHFRTKMKLDRMKEKIDEIVNRDYSNIADVEDEDPTSDLTKYRKA